MAQSDREQTALLRRIAESLEALEREKKVDAPKASPNWLVRSSKTADDLVGRFVKPIEKSAILQLLAFCAAIYTIYQLNVDLRDRAGEREDRERNKIQQMQVRLSARSEADNGRGDALNYLLASGWPVDGLELSCRIIGNTEKTDADPEFCRHDPEISHINFGNTIPIDNAFSYYSKIFYSNSSFKFSFPWNNAINIPAFKNIKITNSNLIGLLISQNKFSNVHFISDDLRYTRFGLRRAPGIDTEWNIAPKNMIIERSDMRYATFRQLNLDSIWETNISNATIRMASPIEKEMKRIEKTSHPPDMDEANINMIRDQTHAWAWADEPPILSRGDRKSYDIVRYVEEFESINSELPNAIVLCDPTVPNLEDTDAGQGERLPEIWSEKLLHRYKYLYENRIYLGSENKSNTAKMVGYPFDASVWLPHHYLRYQMDDILNGATHGMSISEQFSDSPFASCHRISVKDAEKKFPDVYAKMNKELAKPRWGFQDYLE